MKRCRSTPTLDGLSLCIFLTLCTLSLVTLYRHSMWRDEYQSWLIAYASESIFSIFKNLKHEGHPGLWHLMLYSLQGITDKVVHMKVLQGSIALITLCLVFFTAPFSRTQKLLICSSAALGYEYFVFSRSYSSGVLFLFLYCVLSRHHRYKHYHVLRSLTLGLAANTSIFGFFLATALCVHQLLELRVLEKRPSLLVIAPYLLGSLLCIMTIFPSSQTVMPLTLVEDAPMKGNWILDTESVAEVFSIESVQRYLTEEFPTRLKTAVISLLWTPFFPIFYHTRALRIVSLIALGLILITLYRKKQYPLYIFGLYLLMEFPFYLIFFQGYHRHFLMVYIAFIVMLWLSDKPQDKQLQRILSCFLSFQAFVGLHLHYHHNQKPYSMIDETLEDLKEHYGQEGLQEVFLIGMKTMNTSGLAAHLKRPLYNPALDTMQLFRSHDKKSLSTDYNCALAAVNIFNKLQHVKKTAVFVSNFNAEEHPEFTDCLVLGKILEPRRKTSVGNERFWAYEVYPKAIESCPPNGSDSLN